MTTLSPPLSPQHTRDQRPRAISSMSHASTHSKRSSKSEKIKLDLTESARDKRRLEGKSDPTKALSEAQPAQLAQEQATLVDIRTMQYKDGEGNVISDPDRSNPTRPRLERPLDTIRSFNAAADGTACRRASYQKPSPGAGWDAQSRRSSYYGGQPSVYSPSGRQPRQTNGGYYRQSSYGFRPDSYIDERGSNVSAAPPPPRHQRYQSAPYGQPQQQPGYPPSLHSQQHSYETMTSGSDENSKSTAPSSQNSSYDAIHQMAPKRQQYPQEDYGIEFGQNTEDFVPVSPGGRPLHPAEIMRNGYPKQQGYPNQQPVRPPQTYAPPPPAKEPIRLTTGQEDEFGMMPPKQDKRKSWIKRTFSKRN